VSKNNCVQVHFLEFHSGRTLIPQDLRHDSNICVLMTACVYIYKSMRRVFKELSWLVSVDTTMCVCVFSIPQKVEYVSGREYIRTSMYFASSSVNIFY